MTFLTVLGVFNYGLVLIYGLFLSVFIAGGWEKGSQRRHRIAVAIHLFQKLPFFFL